MPVPAPMPAPHLLVKGVYVGDQSNLIEEIVELGDVPAHARAHATYACARISWMHVYMLHMSTYVCMYTWMPMRMREVVELGGVPIAREVGELSEIAPSCRCRCVRLHHRLVPACMHTCTHVRTCTRTHAPCR